MNMTQLKNKITLLAVLTVAATSAIAGHDDEYSNGRHEDYARVKSVTPEYERVNNPRQVCSNEYMSDSGRHHEQARADRSYSGTVLGGITGALVGSRFGKGNGNSAAIAAGAIAGAVIGDKIQGNGSAYSEDDDVHDRRGRVVRRCSTVDNWEKHLTGYRVVYEYAGRTYSTVMPNDPGRTIPVRVSVVPSMAQISRNSYH